MVRLCLPFKIPKINNYKSHLKAKMSIILHQMRNISFQNKTFKKERERLLLVS